MPAKKSTKKSKPGTRSAAFRIATEINSVIGSPVLTLGNDPTYKIVKIPSGSLAIDRILGGGFALGRHIEIYGDESVCKTTICYMTMALSQARGNVCALIDPEHAFDPVWFDHLGGHSDELLIWPPKDDDQKGKVPVAEEAIEAMMLLFQKRVEVITVDSVAAFSTKEEIRKAPNAETDVRIASQARFMSTNLRRLTTANQGTLCLWTNQNRTKIGTFFGDPNTQSGGRALKYYDTARIELRRGEAIKGKAKQVRPGGKIVEGTVRRGYWVYARAHKNKASREGLEATFMFDTEKGGIDQLSEVIQLGLMDGLITRSDRYYSYIDYDEIEWKGPEAKFKTMIAENPALLEELVECIEDETLRLAFPAGHNE